MKLKTYLNTIPLLFTVTLPTILTSCSNSNLINAEEIEPVMPFSDEFDTSSLIPLNENVPSHYDLSKTNLYRPFLYPLLNFSTYESEKKCNIGYRFSPIPFDLSVGDNSEDTFEPEIGSTDYVKSYYFFVDSKVSPTFAQFYNDFTPVENKNYWNNDIVLKEDTRYSTYNHDFIEYENQKKEKINYQYAEFSTCAVIANGDDELFYNVNDKSILQMYSQDYSISLLDKYLVNNGDNFLENYIIDPYNSTYITNDSQKVKSSFFDITRIFNYMNFLGENKFNLNNPSIFFEDQFTNLFSITPILYTIKPENDSSHREWRYSIIISYLDNLFLNHLDLTEYGSWSYNEEDKTRIIRRQSIKFTIQIDGKINNSNGVINNEK